MTKGSQTIPVPYVEAFNPPDRRAAGRMSTELAELAYSVAFQGKAAQVDSPIR